MTRMSPYVSRTELSFQETALRGVIIEHSPYVSAGQVGGQNLALLGWQALAKSVTNTGPNIDFVEFRFPHHKKQKFFRELKGLHRHTASLANADFYYITYGKMNTYQGKVLSFRDVHGQTFDGISAGMQLGEGIGLVVTAAGVTVATAGITLGVGLGVAALAVAYTAAKNHRENLKKRQVFLRISRSAYSTVAKNYFPYEDKVYWTHSMFAEDPIEFVDLGRWVQPGGAPA
ncbi:MAG: hypothetical protein ACR2QM_18140 [Longimicrobiales bacterium]